MGGRRSAYREAGENMHTRTVRPQVGIEPATFSLWGSSANQRTTLDTVTAGKAQV